LAASRSPSPLPSPTGRGNRYPASFLSRTWLSFMPCAPRFNAQTPARPSAFDSPLGGRRFSLSPCWRRKSLFSVSATPPNDETTNFRARHLASAAACDEAKERKARAARSENQRHVHRPTIAMAKTRLSGKAPAASKQSVNGARPAAGTKGRLDSKWISVSVNLRPAAGADWSVGRPPALHRPDGNCLACAPSWNYLPGSLFPSGSPGARAFNRVQPSHHRRPAA
jgi:hypothetical protein